MGDEILLWQPRIFFTSGAAIYHTQVELDASA